MIQALRGLVTALRTLTLVRVPGRDADCVASALPWFPVVGGFGGLLVVACGWGAMLVLPQWPEFAALAMGVAGCVLTRGLHLDGLADCADGFGGGRTRDDVLRIMKDPRVGSFGTVAVVLALLGKWVALVPLAEWGEWSWVVLAWVVSRVGSVLLMGLLPYARAEGGTAGPFVAGARPWQIGVAFVVMAAITWGLVGFDAWSWAALAVGMLGVVVFGAHCRSRLGGITGDTLGACSEGVEVAILLLGAASLAV